MRTSRKTVEEIGQFEGLSLKAYRCPSGVLTIGYGHTSGVTEGMVITKEQATSLLEQDLQYFEREVGKTFATVSLTQNQFDALVSLAFNIGASRLKHSLMAKKIQANKDDMSIRDEFMKYVNSKGRVLPGLVRRRKWEADLYFKKQ